MRKNAEGLVATVVAAALVVLPAPAARAGTMTGGATEWTQLGNMVQLIQHTVHLGQSVGALYRQVHYLSQASRRIASPQDAFMLLNGFASVLAQMQGLLFAGESMARRWGLTHPGSHAPEALGLRPEQAYRNIDESTRKAVERSMEALDLQASSADGWPQDRKIYADLTDKVRTVEGQLQASMVANELLLEIIRQLHLLRQVQIAQAEMMGYHVSREVQREQYADKLREERVRYQGLYRGDGEIEWGSALGGF